MCSALRPWYGRACATGEFDAKNMVLENGVHSVGVDISRSLPGLYWLSFFGEYCVNSIGLQKFERTGAYEQVSLANGILLAPRP